MGILVSNGVFTPVQPDEFSFIPVDEIDGATNHAVDLPSSSNPQDIIDRVNKAPAIRIQFPSSADGRGFSIASALRRAGYRGHLRASGHVLADQYPLAVRAGFDDVEISNELAERQPEDQWAEALTRTEFGYREQLMRSTSQTV